MDILAYRRSTFVRPGVEGTQAAASMERMG